MKTIFLLLTICLMLSCEEYHKSELKQEKGIVVAKEYRGEINETEMAVGMSMEGSIAVVPYHIHESEKFNVVFKCEHGKLFTINNSDIYSKLSEGDQVKIDYYEILNEDNEVKDLDFVDANKVSL